MFTVFLVENDFAVRNSLRRRLELEPDLLILGESDGKEVNADEICALKPDVALVDLHILYVDGIERARLIMELLPATRVIILTMDDSSESRSKAREAGVSAFISKHEPEAALLEAIRNEKSWPFPESSESFGYTG